MDVLEGYVDLNLRSKHDELRSIRRVSEAYNNVAACFEKVPDLNGAMYFETRCVDVAKEFDARESMSKAVLNLGACEERRAIGRRPWSTTRRPCRARRLRTF